jgi:hypothetical protein
VGRRTDLGNDLIGCEGEEVVAQGTAEAAGSGCFVVGHSWEALIGRGPHK